MTVKRVYKFVGYSGIWIILCIFLSFGIARADEETTVDDLFIFLIDKWANEINFSTFEAKVITLQPIIGLPIESNFKETLQAFTEDLRSSEDIYGHLPEYWELRAFVDLGPDFDWTSKDIEWNVRSIFSLHYKPVRLNRNMLQKALDIDPSRGSVKWLYEHILLEDEYPKGVRWSGPEKADQFREYNARRAEICADAGEAEPQNAFYSIYEAVHSYFSGDRVRALDAIDRAGNCEYFSFPRIFPSTYALPKIFEFECREALFDDITPGARISLFSSFYHGADSLPNYIQVKDMYKGLIAEAEEDDLPDLLTDLHRAACVMGKGEGNESINALVAAVLVKICLREAMHSAGESGDYDLERAVIAAIAEIDNIKAIHKAGWKSEFSALTSTFLYTILIDELDQSLGEITDNAFEIRLSEVLRPVLHFRITWRIHEERIKPVFEELETFDYSKPGEWYDNWFQKMFPEPEE